MSFPTHRQAGQPWFECHICGFYYPLSEGTKHYRSQKLVDQKCADEPGHADYMELDSSHVREEERRVSPQSVKNQGDIFPVDEEAESGAGGGGAGGGGAV